MKQLNEMGIVETLEVLKLGLEDISKNGRLPEIRLLNMFIDHAISAYDQEANALHDQEKSAKCG